MQNFVIFGGFVGILGIILMVISRLRAFRGDSRGLR